MSKNSTAELEKKMIPTEPVTLQPNEVAEIGDIKNRLKNRLTTLGVIGKPEADELKDNQKLIIKEISALLPGENLEEIRNFIQDIEEDPEIKEQLVKIRESLDKKIIPEEYWQVVELFSDDKKAS